MLKKVWELQAKKRPQTNTEIKNGIKKTIKKWVNESKSLEEKQNWINKYRGTYSKNKEIIQFLNEIEDNLDRTRELNNLLQITEDIPEAKAPVSNEEDLQEKQKRRAEITEQLKKKKDARTTEAAAKGKVRQLGGGKKTSKRQSIRHTFRKKDKQSKKKNVSRKK